MKHKSDSDFQRPMLGIKCSLRGSRDTKTRSNIRGTEARGALVSPSKNVGGNKPREQDDEKD